MYTQFPNEMRPSLFRAVIRNPNFPLPARMKVPVLFDNHDPDETLREIIIDGILVDTDYSNRQKTDIYHRFLEIFEEEMPKVLHKSRFSNSLRNIPGALTGMTSRRAFNRLGSNQHSFHSPMGKEFLEALGAPPVVAPNRGSSRKLNELRRKNRLKGLQRVNTSLFNGGRRNSTRRKSKSY